MCKKIYGQTNFICLPKWNSESLSKWFQSLHCCKAVLRICPTQPRDTLCTDGWRKDTLISFWVINQRILTGKDFWRSSGPTASLKGKTLRSGWGPQAAHSSSLTYLHAMDAFIQEFPQQRLTSQPNDFQVQLLFYSHFYGSKTDLSNHNSLKKHIKAWFTWSLTG